MSSSRTGMQDSQQMEHDQAQMSGEDSQDMTVGYADEEESSRGGAGKMIVGVVLVAILAIIIGCCACGGSKEEEVKEAADEGAVQATEEEPNQGFLAPSAEGEVAESSEQSEGCPMWVILTSAIGGAVVVIVTTVIICCCCCGSSQNSALIFDSKKNENAKIQLAKYTDDMKTKMQATETACNALVDAANATESATTTRNKAVCAGFYGTHFTVSEVSNGDLKAVQFKTSMNPSQYAAWVSVKRNALVATAMYTDMEGNAEYGAAAIEGIEKTKGDKAEKFDEAKKEFQTKLKEAKDAYKCVFFNDAESSMIYLPSMIQENIEITDKSTAEELKKTVDAAAAKDNTYAFVSYTVTAKAEKEQLTHTIEGSVDPISACELSSSGAAKAEEPKK